MMIVRKIKFLKNLFKKTLNANLSISITTTIVMVYGLFGINNTFARDRFDSQDPSSDIPLTTDSRIKTYIYSPNEVFLLVLHYGFQSHIEFSKGEIIDTITLGDTYAWKIVPIDNRLFIRPMEKNIRTNMTIITNKKTYQFDLVAKELEDGEEQDLVYLVRFYYPEKRPRAKL